MREELSSFIDALFAYALDPAQWDDLFLELERNSELLERIDPTELLVSLSHAEALAWQLKSETQGAEPASYAYVLFDRHHRMVERSENCELLKPYIEVAKDGKKIEFGGQDTEYALQDALRAVQLEGGHRLLELQGQGHPSLYGYVVQRAAFPGALSTDSKTAETALLVPLERPTEQLQQILRSSFGLTGAEAGVAHQLASGRSIKEAAAELGVSVNTVRNQLQAVFQKSGIRRQSDLILLVTQLSVLLAAIARRAAEQHSKSAASIDSPDHPERQFVVLPRGGRVAYRRYGEGEHSVVFLHETVGCSRLPTGSAALCHSQNLSIVALDRPGCGFSDPLDQYSFAAVAEQLRRFFDELNIERATLMGNISGAAFALSAAALMPERIEHVFCISGRPPVQGARSGLNSLQALRKRLVEQPWVLKTVFNILRSRSSPQMNTRTLKRIYGRCPPDLEAIENNPLVLEYLLSSTLESMTVDSGGVAGDLACFAYAAEFDHNALRMPITVWHGKEDVVAAPEAIPEFLGDIPHDYRLFESAGALLMLTHWPDVIKALGAIGR